MSDQKNHLCRRCKRDVVSRANGTYPYRCSECAKRRAENEVRRFNERKANHLCTRCKTPIPISENGTYEVRCLNCITHASQIKLTSYRRYPERNCVANHYQLIFGRPGKHLTYKGMPFFDGWNPKKGGCFVDGGDWIVQNLGPRPKGCSIDIVDRLLGFVPGNLKWSTPKGQAWNQMHRTITEQRNLIDSLTEELNTLKEKQ